MKIAKVRIDRWDAALDETTRWKAYEAFTRCRHAAFLVWCNEQIPDTALPSRTALYAWAATMRQQEMARRLADAHTAQIEAGQIAEAGGVDDETLSMALKSLATDFVLRKGNIADATALIKSAVSLRESGTRAEALRLLREKFEASERRLEAVQEAVGQANAEGGLTAETLKKIEQAVGLL